MIKRCDVLTLFPSAVEAYLAVGALGQAAAKGILELRVHDLRRWAVNRYGQVDDEAYGGGPGMVLIAPVVVQAVRDVAGTGQPHVAVPDPRGRRFDDGVARELAGYERLVFVCGRYEGLDERAYGLIGADQLSLGDFILTGGELPALAMLEAAARFVPGVVGDPESVRCDSFAAGLLDYPVFTRPRDVEGREVPSVLLSGNHAAIASWRLQESVRATVVRRPDLVASRWGELSAEVRRLVHEVSHEEGVPDPSPRE